MKFRVFTLLILSINCFVEHVRCSKILVLAMAPSYSHHVIYPPLLLELTSRGHEIVLVTAAPTSRLDVPNIKQIDISKVFKVRKNFNAIRDRFNGVSWLSFVEDELIRMYELSSEEIFKHPQIKQLYKPNSNATFDLVMLEMFHSTSLLALGHRFNAPTIGYSPMGILNIYDHICGAPVFTSHESNWEIEQNAGPNLSFWQRLQNFAIMWRHIYFQYNYFIPRQQLIAEKYLGPGVPPILDLIRNVSLVFINADEVLNPARPRLSNHILYNSPHVSANITPPTKGLKRFFDDAKEGFIYFSLGTNAPINMLPKETLQIFLDVFAKLPYKVAWKFEGELPGKSDNVFISSWLPQQTILAQPNIKLFIYQGGVHSGSEAVHFGVPVLVLPIFADQFYQARTIENMGIGKYLDIVTLTRDKLERTIRDIITDNN
ncbi:UDP-glycosyltransferase UGT5-like isoform X2 [Nomia melanderi]|uniref:UDP-glycosyltransferase UGT5-like isoform X2 n=1 Tax=Nomia melanderi TaxID=2448451 RepID=UPI003FCD4CDE